MQGSKPSGGSSGGSSAGVSEGEESKDESTDSENKDTSENTEKPKENGGESVENSEKSGKIKEQNRKPITQITDNSIERVPMVEIQGYTKEQCAEIQRQHKELLKYARDNNDSKEVAFVFDSKIENRREFKGSDDSLDFGSALHGKDLVVMHSHPRNGSYSTMDIKFFGDNDSVKAFSIAKNNGGVEVIVKSNDFDLSVFKIEYARLHNKIVKSGTNAEKDKFVKALLSKTKSGVIWYASK